MIEADIELPLRGFSRCDAHWSRAAGDYADYHRCYFPVKGRAWIEWMRPGGPGNERRVLRPGGAYLIPGNRHIAYGCAREFHVYWFHVRWRGAWDLSSRLACLPSVVSLGQAWARKSRATWLTLALSESAMRDSHRLALSALALEALTAALTLAERPAGARDDAATPDPGAMRRLAPVLAFMDTHFRTNPSLESLAGRAHLSPSHFHKLFTQSMGTTPHDYMLARRMRLARRLLLQSDEPIGTIASETGYDNAFYFSRTFKKSFGQSPRAARSQRRAPAGP